MAFLFSSSLKICAAKKRSSTNCLLLYRMTDSISSIFVRFKSHFANWREWELNPIVIKELRQAVRSWAVTGMLLLFLAVLFIAAVGFLVTQSFSVDTNMEL